MNEPKNGREALLLICDEDWSIVDALCMLEGEVQVQRQLVGTRFPDLARDPEANLDLFMRTLRSGSLASNIELALKYHGRETTLHFFGSLQHGVGSTRPPAVM